MAKSPAEQHRELTNALSTLTERLDNLREDVREIPTIRDRTTEALNDLRRELDLLKQRLDDHIRRTEVWDNRRWGLILLLVGAVFSLASGLIVTLARK